MLEERGEGERVRHQFSREHIEFKCLIPTKIQAPGLYMFYTDRH